MKVYTVEVGMDEFYVGGGGGHNTLRRVIIEVITDKGLIGLGEARGGKETGLIIKQMVPYLRGKDPFAIEKNFHELEGFRFRYGIDGKVATGAIEMACLDIMGKSWNVPVYQLLGGKVREKIKINGCLGAYPLRDVASQKELRAAFENLDNIQKIIEHADKVVSKFGFKSLKFKSAALSKYWDVALFKALRDHFEEEFELRIDPNGHWSYRDAIYICNGLEPYNLEWIEDPCISTEAMSRIHQKIRTPIGTNMCAVSLEEISTAIRLNAIDVVLGDPLEWGGTLAVKKLAGICEAFELDMSLHSSGELGVGTAIYLHIVASTPILTHAIDSLYYIAKDDVIKERFIIKDGCIPMPEKPGLGVELDHKKLEKFGSELIDERKRCVQV